ncbi:vWA domain-containing protein [Dysgonomonas macrotermitis]|uniref:von Willebrand factor type A domain-containing protein n=1 Tax=Dysgonomonas macrotermitis TaxID=1346286 RepID=A0A1M5CJS0_9BACT|nr:VWA domain-containing protein [Dysgonomonas macrotermitis]SHF54936.1 von Willebrand factor type A domain-containing protein [Dysgonomonas macrotermitis]
MKRFIFSILVIACFTTISAQVGTSAGSFNYIRSAASNRSVNSFSMPAETNFIIEDFVNYHKHNITIPQETDVALSIDYDNSILSNPDELVLQIGVATQPAEYHRCSDKQVNVALVIDISTSMRGQKIEVVKKSMHKFINALNEGDYLSVSVFSTDASVLLPTTRLGKDRKEILSLIDQISVNGMTNLNAGMELGYTEALKRHAENTNSRVILLTDGETNQGEIDPEKIVQNSNRYTKRGINISTIGVGQSLDFDLLRQLADEGRGTNYFLGDNTEDIDKVFTEELGSLLYHIGNNPKLTVNLPEGYEILQCYGYNPKMEGSGSVDFELSDLNANSTRVVLIKLRRNTKCEDKSPIISVSLTYVKGKETISVPCSRKLSITSKSITNPEVGKNYSIAFMADALKSAAREYTSDNTDKSKSILNNAVLLLNNSEYRYDDDFKRTFDIIKSYAPIIDECTEKEFIKPKIVI